MWVVKVNSYSGKYRPKISVLNKNHCPSYVLNPGPGSKLWTIYILHSTASGCSSINIVVINSFITSLSDAFPLLNSRRCLGHTGKQSDNIQYIFQIASLVQNSGLLLRLFLERVCYPVQCVYKRRTTWAKILYGQYVFIIYCKIGNILGNYETLDGKAVPHRMFPA